MTTIKNLTHEESFALINEVIGTYSEGRESGNLYFVIKFNGGWFVADDFGAIDGPYEKKWEAQQSADEENGIYEGDALE